MTSATSSFRPANRLIILGLIVPCLLISVPAVIAYRAQEQLTDSFHWVSHTLEVQRNIQRLFALIVDAETGQRGFLLTGKELYLKSYEASREQILGQAKTLRILTENNPGQQEHLRKLDDLIAAKLAFIAQVVFMQRAQQHEGALALIDTDRGVKDMDDIRVHLTLMEKEEARLLLEREDHLVTQARFSTWVLSSLVAVNLAFAAAVFLMFRRLSKVQTLVTVCAWSRTVEYQGEWLSFEEYLLRRFNLNTSHTISPAEAERAFVDLKRK